MENKKAGLIFEFLKFGVTGGLGTITNLLIFYFLVDVNNLPEIPISIFCFIIAGTQNYLLNHLWTFKKYTDKTRISVAKWFWFLFGSLFGLAVNIFVMKLIIINIVLQYKFIAQACGIAAGMVVNFFMSKYIIFREVKNDNQ